MDISDLSKLSSHASFDCDLCIMGAGPAGITIATELATCGRSILVLESGGRTREDAFSTALNEIESVGAPRVMDQQTVRNRVLGGSSHTWSGRCTSLDEIDLAFRSWVPQSGWPVNLEEMANYTRRAATYLGLVEEVCVSAPPEEELLRERLALTEQSALRPVSWQFSSDPRLYNDYVRFGPRFAKLKAANTRVLTHATLTEILLSPDGTRVERLEIASPRGKRYTVRCQTVILCGGGLENARILLASNGQEAPGIGNRNGLVGRFLMDHPRAHVGTFPTAGSAHVQELFGLVHSASGARVQCGLSLSASVQQQERLLNCAAWTTQHVAEDDVWRALREFGQSANRNRLASAKKVALSAHQILSGLWSKYAMGKPLPRRLSRLNLDVMVEQAPNRESQVTLSERKDALGMPLSRVDWRLCEQERETTIRLAHAVNATLAKAGLPTAELVDWVREKRPEDAVFVDPAHPIGTTRMAATDKDGVVDRDSKVFGIDNLYIAGSSVFPTSGHANPTLMIVAMAIRLADTLRQQTRTALPNSLCREVGTLRVDAGHDLLPAYPAEGR